MAFRNEGTPFRDFGPHTQQKALLEARARFSEESWLNVSGLRLLQHNPHTTGRLKENSRNHLTIAITLPSVNRCSHRIVSPPTSSIQSRQGTTVVLTMCFHV